MNLLRRSQIEIEKRFVVHPLIKQQLNTHGAKLIKTVKFYDTYFDTVDCILTCNNQWLRLRDDRWQLKQPIDGFNANANNKESTAIYEEFDNIEKIAKEIFQEFSEFQSFHIYCNHTSETIAIDNVLFKNWLQSILKMDVLAQFVTNRESYEIMHNGRKYEIELDFTDFYYNVMEVETILELEFDLDLDLEDKYKNTGISNVNEFQRKAVTNATKDLNDFCKYLLDCDEWQMSLTKIEIYLWLFNYGAYEKICNADMFPIIDENMQHQIMSCIEKNKVSETIKARL